MAAFTWFPDAGSLPKQVEPRVKGVKFGDGYEQRVGDGINPIAERFPVTFTVTLAQAAAIDAFLKARGGWEAFDWTTPWNRTARFICRKWSVTRARAATATVSCEFEEVFGS